MLSYLMTARLAALCPNAVLQKLDLFVEPLRATCTAKNKPNSVKQEYEKQDELKRSALRALSALAAIPKADKNPTMAEFLKYIQNTTDLQTVYQAVQKDSLNATLNATYMDTLVSDNAMDQS